MGVNVSDLPESVHLVRAGHGSLYLARRLRDADPGADWPGPTGARTVLDVARDDGGATGPTDDADVSWLRTQLAFGGPSTTLLDMQGIESFMFGRAKLFDDRHALLMAHELLPLEPGTRYLRIGAAGAPPSSQHPGGEVLEEAHVRNGRLEGRSRTVSGYLRAGSETTSSSPMEVDGRAWHRRSVYSHTAFLPELARQPASYVLSGADAPSHTVDLLPWITRTVQAAGIGGFSMRLRVTAGARPTSVVGRALRRLPHGPLQGVTEATSIASEVRFELEPGQSLVAYGTHRPRHEPLWEQWRDGKAYEPSGHLHFRLEPAGRDGQHAVGHLRSLEVAPGASFVVLVDPAGGVLRVDPVRVNGDWVVSAASGRRLLRRDLVDSVGRVDPVDADGGEVW